MTSNYSGPESIAEEAIALDSESNDTFDLFFERYGVYDYCVYMFGIYWRCRCYYDGGWLEGYNCQPVVYWGA